MFGVMKKRDIQRHVCLSLSHVTVRIRQEERSRRSVEVREACVCLCMCACACRCAFLCCVERSLLTQLFFFFFLLQASRQFDQEGRKKFFTLDMNNILLE